MDHRQDAEPLESLCYVQYLQYSMYALITSYLHLETVSNLRMYYSPGARGVFHMYEYFQQQKEQGSSCSTIFLAMNSQNPAFNPHGTGDLN